MSLKLGAVESWVRLKSGKALPLLVVTIFTINDSLTAKERQLELALSEATEGMTTLADVCDRSGRVLVGSGVCLDGKQLKLLRAWGIRTIHVTDANAGKPDEVVGDLDFTALEQAAADLFAPADLSHPLVKKLIPIVARQLGKQSGGGRG